MFGACANPPLQRVPEGVPPLDNELEIRGQVCATQTDAVFPVKILFLVDVSGSMVVTDPADIRVEAVENIINQYQGQPGVEFGVIAFSSSILDVTNGFTFQPDIAMISQALKQADDQTDDQGVLGAAYELLSTDMLASTAAERARSKYIIILFTDGTPDPLCNADSSPCGPSLTCAAGTSCNPTTVLNAQSQEQEQYGCTTDDLICTVPKRQVDVEHGFADLARRGKRERAAARRGSAGEDDRAVRVAHVRARAVAVGGRESLREAIHPRNRAVLGATACRAPATLLDAESDGGVEATSIGSRLAAAHNPNDKRLHGFLAASRSMLSIARCMRSRPTTFAEWMRIVGGANPRIATASSIHTATV